MDHPVEKSFVRKTLDTPCLTVLRWAADVIFSFQPFILYIAGAIFENSVGLNVVMSGDGDASDSSDVGDFSEYNSQSRRGGGLVGLQNIGKIFLIKFY